MARNPLPYRTVNDLTRVFMMEQARRTTVSKGGTRPSFKDIEDELAKYCNVTQDTINLIRRNKNQPSLQVAMKICEYLEVKVEDVFRLDENSEVDAITPTQLKKIDLIENSTDEVFTGSTFEEAKAFILANGESTSEQD